MRFRYSAGSRQPLPHLPLAAESGHEVAQQQFKAQTSGPETAAEWRGFGYEEGHYFDLPLLLAQFQ